MPPRRAPLALLFVVVIIAPPARADTHTSPLTPTGALVAPGHVERTQSAVAAYHELALGVTDGVELRLGSPGLPLPILGGDLQLRIAPLPPDAPVTLVLSGGVLAEWVNGGDLWIGGGATVAWRGLHATVRRYAHHAPRAERGERLGLVTAGVAHRTRRVTWFAEVGELSRARPATCTDKHGAPRRCRDRAAVTGALIGAWWQRRSFAVGVSALVARHDATTIPILPLLSFRWDRDL